MNYPRRKKARDSSTFVDRRDVVRHSRTSLHICNICRSKSDTPGHPSKAIVKRWSADKPYVAVSGDPEHPDPQLAEKQQKELMEEMKKEIQEAKEKEEESSSTESESTDSEDEVKKAAKQVGIAVEDLGPVGPEDAEIPDIPDGEALAAFLEDKKAEKAAEKAAKEEEVPAEESAASKRKSGVTEAGKRMLDQTLDEIAVDIQEEVPPSQRNALFGLPGHRPHQPMHQRWSPRVRDQRRLRQRFHLQVSQFLQSLSRMSQRIMIASWRLAKLVLVAAELIRT